MDRLIGKSVVITGAGLGIGHAAAILMADEGAQVAVTDIDIENGIKTVKCIHSRGGRAEFWKLDTSDEQMVKDVFKEIQEKFTKIDVLVNNAGISGANKPTHEITSEEWDTVMNINVKGVFFCTKHAIPYMKEAGAGSIINLSSIYGLVSAADVPAYHASKGAVRLMSKTDALLYAKDKIRVNSVHPGFIWTPMVDNFLKDSGSPDEGLKALNALHPLGHLGAPKDIAYGIVYLASDESRFVTGSELVIDGGYTAR
jgi:NAD(P)-dependent dehydrogenase (short-subunit alcohol dehydrogenase family)